MSRLLVACAGLALVGCAPAPTPEAPSEAKVGPRDLTVAFQSNVQGDIEPCG